MTTSAPKAGLAGSKQAARRLRLYRQVIANMSDPLSLVDERWRYLERNDAHRALFGYTDKEFFRMSPADLVGQETFEAVTRELLAKGSYRGEMTYRGSGGRLIQVETSVFPVRDEAGRTIGYAGCHRDIGARKRTEEDLRRTTAELRALLGTLPDLYFRLDARGKILDYHAPSEADLLMAPEKFLGRTMSEVLPASAAGRLEEGLRRAVRDRRVMAVEYTLPMAAGPRTYEARFVPFLEDQVVAFVRNTTERKRTELRLEAQYAVTRTLAESPTLKAAAPRIVESLCRCLGWTLGAVWEVEPAAGLLRCVDVWRDPAATGAAEFEEVSRTRAFPRGMGLPGRVWAEGKPVWISDVVVDKRFPRAPIAIRSGLHSAFGAPILLGAEILGVLEFFSPEIRPPDVDLLQMIAGVGSQVGQFIERRRAEQELRFQKSVLESQSEASIDAILLVSPEGRILSFNRRFVQLWGIPDEVLRTRSDEAALDSVMDKLARPEEFRSRVEHLYRHPREESREEIQLKDGRTFDRHSAPVRGEDGTILGRVWHFRDITTERRQEEGARRAAEEIRRAYEELKRAQAQLVRSEKLASVGMLVSGVAHEINNPINVVFGNLKLLRERCATLNRIAAGATVTPAARKALSRAPRMLRDALKAAEAARKVIQEFRNFARDPRIAEPTDLNLCVEETLSVVRKDLAGIAVRRKLGKLPPVRCFHGQMNQVLLNLVKNAIEAMGGKGKLTVTTAARGRRVLVTVADTGRGIPRRELRKIFEPFYTTKEGGRGMGLGLSISASILQNHGGRLRVASRPGRGTTFTVELPLK
ncbi:MAG TPA: PAS domain-containing protein [Planctomycetota bacterium]